MREADFEVLLHLVERLSDEQRTALGRALAAASGEPEAVRLVERASAATRNRFPSSATLKCPATSATCPPPASQRPAYRPRHPAGTVTEHISRKPYYEGSFRVGCWEADCR